MEFSAVFMGAGSLFAGRMEVEEGRDGSPHPRGQRVKDGFPPPVLMGAGYFGV